MIYDLILEYSVKQAYLSGYKKGRQDALEDKDDEYFEEIFERTKNIVDEIFIF